MKNLQTTKLIGTSFGYIDTILYNYMGMRELVIPRENPVNDYFEARVSLFK